MNEKQALVQKIEDRIRGLPRTYTKMKITWQHEEVKENQCFGVPLHEILIYLSELKRELA